jgi:DNA-binding transcriptional regulator GbsR (MarR family)
MTKGKDIEVPQAVCECGPAGVAVFKALFSHEHMSVDTIAERSGITPKSIGPAMTHLRRSGWVESKGPRGHRLWKRRREWAEPQPDFAHRKANGKAERHDAEYHLAEAAKHINEALKQVSLLRELQAIAAKLPPPDAGHD